MEEVDYKDIGKQIFDAYFDTYDNTENLDTAKENANGILGDFQYEELKPNEVKIIIQTISERLKNCEKDIGYELS